MTSRAAVVVRTLAAVALAALLAPPVVAAVDEAVDQVVIEAKGLRPPHLDTTTARRVKFINRSGQPAHLEFIGDPGEHQVFQVPGLMWAVFHRPGRHPYVVHLEGKKNIVALHGMVDVTEDPSGTVDLPTCDPVTLHGRTVMGECLVP